jgi:glycosyltransferase involved in cell wall biosynthesis
MRIALVHDHLISDGGGERVLKAFAEIWPEAPIYTLIHDPQRTHVFFNSKDIRTTYLQNLPFKTAKYQWYLPLRPRAVEKFKFDDFDVVLSNSSSLIKGIRTSSNTLHIDYCHTPTRFLWVDPRERLDPLEKYWPISRLSRAYKEKLKIWDLRAVSGIDRFITNSQNVRYRINKYYGHDARVIYPPVDVDKFQVAEQPGNYFLAGGRITSYKRFDMVVDTFNRALIPLKIFGVGPWLKAVRRKAGPHIQFVGQVSEEQKAKLFAKALAFINPQVEDFGITAVESMAAGRPVIALKAGGAMETVIPGKTGVFFEDHDWAALADAVIRFNHKRFDPQLIRRHAMQFSADRFKQQIKEFVENAWANFN